jgi:PadR family transcriptional regulator, regulatory protein PadR
MTRNYAAHSYWAGILNASLCKFFILRALCDGPAHGYEIIRRVARISDEFCVPTEGTIYPALSEFQQCGCVTCHPEIVNGRTRKVYTLTPQGQDAYKAGEEVWHQGLSSVQRVVKKKR